ncbi:MAG TPA: sugar ABC transporter permease, partial [Acidimicrobiales bacterium]|nr:sugar ABC transporter permease [Acidimicrobiales bacterium]
MTVTAVPAQKAPEQRGGTTTGRRHRGAKLPAARFLLPALVLYGLVFIVPFLGSLPLSFSNWNGISRFAFNGVSNLADVVTNASFLAALRHNAIMVGAFFLLTNVVGLGLALLLNRRPAGYQIYRTLIFLPAILSLVATGFIWTVMLDPQIGVVNPALKAIGLGFFQPQWLSSPRLALGMVILVSWWQWGGVPMVIYGAGLKAIPTQLLDAAEVDGAIGLRRLRYVIIPLLRPAIVVTTILTFVTCFQSFAVVYVLEGVEGAPGGATDVVGTLIYRTAFGNGIYSSTTNLGFSEANAVGVMVILSVGMILLQMYFR